MTVAVVSGGFDPLHVGHLSMLEHAATLGDVYVLLNSDDWLVRKKGYVFMPWEQRARILTALECVREVWPVADIDGHVASGIAEVRRLLKVKPVIFCNGGDQESADPHEVILCRKQGVTMAYHVGGGKIASSTEMVERAKA